MKIRKTRTLPLLLGSAVLWAWVPAAALARLRPAESDLERGLELFRNDHFEKAVDALQRATEAEPGNPEPWTYLGLSEIELGKPREALSPLHRAVEVDPDFAEAHYGLGLAHGYLDEVDAAIAEFTRTIELAPDHARAHYQLGLAYNEKGRIDLALLHLERFLDLAPDAEEAPRVRELLKRLR